MRSRALGLSAAMALVLPRAVLACAVCGGGNPANRFAFFASTIALSLLPLGLFAGAFLWLRSRLGDRGRSEFQERDPVTPGSGPARELRVLPGQDGRIPPPQAG